MLSVRNLHISRSSLPVVRGVSFACEPATWTGIIGANGSGKTTLLRGIAGRLAVTSGEVEIGARDFSRDRCARARRIGFAPDAATLPPSFTGAEILTLAANDCSTDQKPLAELRAALEIDLLAPRRISTMSNGMRQRIAIFCAFVTRSDVVVLDEPFNWLDPVCTFDTKQALRRLVTNTGCCLITALHDLGTLTIQCDAGLLLADGKLIREMCHRELRTGSSDLAAFEGAMIRDLRR